ncbi:MAG: porin [Bdellovibrionota bacterium]
MKKKNRIILGLSFAFGLLWMCPLAMAVERIPFVQSGYEDGFYIKTEDGRYLLKVGTRLNVNYSYAHLDSLADYSSFDLVHAKLYAGGNALGRFLQYYIQAGAGRQTRSYSLFPNESTTGGLRLEDYYIRLRHKGLDLKVGQYKVPVGKQWMIYSGNLNLMHRSIATSQFSLGRDRGVSVQRFQKQYSAIVSIFNGAGPLQTSSQPSALFNTGQNLSNGTSGGSLGHLYVGRLSVHPRGPVGYSEGGVENFETFRWELGSSFAYDQNRGLDVNANNTIDDARASFMHSSSDLHLSYKGISLLGEYFYRKNISVPTYDFYAQGFYVQPSMFLIPQKIETVFRYAWIDPNSQGSSDRSQEIAAGINWYLYPDHRFKIGMNYTRLRQALTGFTRIHHFADLGLQVTL